MRGKPREEALEVSIFEHFGKAILDIRVLLQAVALVAAVVALRAWGPLEVQLKIDSLTQGPLASTSAAVSSAWEQAAGIARSVQHTMGWRTAGSPQSAPDAF